VIRKQTLVCDKQQDSAALEINKTFTAMKSTVAAEVQRNFGLLA